jgi:HAD superfamily hydrolase (TIGR01549 family)
MKLIIFDIDGTLCRSEIADDRCFLNAFRNTLGIEVNNSNWDSYKHATDLKIVGQILEDFKRKSDTESINQIIDAYTEELRILLDNDLNCFTVIPGAKELLKYLSENDGYEIGIATGGFIEPAKYKLMKLDFNIERFETRSSDNFGTKAEMISDIIETFKTNNNIKHEKVFYVGDREYDFKTAKELNINFIGIDFDNNGRLKDLGAEIIFKDFEPIEKFLKVI